jgi:hypothetical protein
MKIDPLSLSALEPEELLQLNGTIIRELHSRGIVRTGNNPLSDYTEWMVSRCLSLTLANNSTRGYDATDELDGLKYEIKARRVTPSNQSRQLSAIRNLDGMHFDVLIAVVYDEDFKVILGLKIPHSVVINKSTYVKATNSYKLEAKDNLKNEAGVVDITQLLRCS